MLFHSYKLRRILRIVFLSIALMFIIGEIGEFKIERRYALLFGAFLGFYVGIFNEFIGFRAVRKLRSWLRLPIQIAIIQIIIIASIITYRLVMTPFTIEDERLGLLTFLTNSDAISLYYKGQIFAFSLLFLFEIEMVLGRKYLRTWFTGKYDRPKKERRIVLFMDLTSSTSIAERLGDDRYYSFLNDCYHLLNVPVMDTRAEILKYVGDEVILSWTYKYGIHKNNALRFILRYKALLNESQEYFERKYGMQPHFRFGLNEGRVVVAYLGGIKRQLDFSGDVMNATARICEACKHHQTEILVAEDLYRDFNALNFDFEIIMNAELRGKVKRMNLVKLKPQMLES